MVRRPPKSKRTDTLFPYTTLFRSTSVGSSSPRTSGRNAPPESPVEPFFLQCIRGFGASYHGSSLLVLATGGGSGYSSAPYKRSEEHTSELQSLMRISYAVFCLKKNNQT